MHQKDEIQSEKFHSSISHQMTALSLHHSIMNPDRLSQYVTSMVAENIGLTVTPNLQIYNPADLCCFFHPDRL